jgi:tetratricopeptide (TPR) repeat protein
VTTTTTRDIRLRSRKTLLSKMGKVRPPERSKLARKQKRARQGPSQTPKELLAHAAALLEQSDPASAHALATAALKQLKKAIKDDQDAIACLPALVLLGECCVELGDIDPARKFFLQAADLDPDGEIPESEGGGADKFLWLAQLSEDGGEDAVQWYQRAAVVLRQEMSGLEDQDQIEAKSRTLGTALCAITEIYMTDLSSLPEAESICSKCMEEALKIAPHEPETLQTVASVRISQNKKEEACSFLTKSLAQWENLSPEDPKYPAFALRISLVRLLLEAEMEKEASEVIEGLLAEDDTSVEAWYQSGFCQYLLAKRCKNSKIANGSTNDLIAEHLKRSRASLKQCLSLFQAQEYEDDQLRDHAMEILEELDKALGEEDVDGEEEEWEDEDEDSEDESDDTDEEMDDG